MTEEGDDKFRQELFGSAFEVQRARALGQVSLLRVFAMGGFLAFAAIAVQSGYPEWGGSVPLLAGYTAAAALLVARQRRGPLSSLVYSFAAIADVLVIFEIQHRTLPRALLPAGVAGWTLAPFTLLVLVGALWLRPLQISAVALSAAICEAVLQQEAGEDLSRIASSVVLLLVAAGAAGLVGRQLKDLVDSVSDGLTRWRDRYLLLLDRNHAGVYRAVIGRGITECNATFARMLGYSSPGEVIGLRRDRIYRDSDREELLAIIQREKKTTGRELQLRRRDGTTVWVLENATLVEDGVVEGVVLDISDRKALQERLLIADRMSALGSLASAVAHEINNPLGYVLGNVEHALENLPAGDPLHEALADAREGALRVRRIVSDMQTLAREDSDQPVLVNLQRVIEAAAGVADVELRKRARVVLELGAMPGVIGSQGRLGQVVLNLLLHAARAIPPGDAAGNRIRVCSGTTADGSAVFEVSDTGTPIPPEVLAQVFSSRAASAGAGLSLAICHGIVTALGGRISARSAPGEGTAFRVELPCAK
jgi:PAS domain S-box-containing protein